jgi:hypothetical protein
MLFKTASIGVLVYDTCQSIIVHGTCAQQVQWLFLQLCDFSRVISGMYCPAAYRRRTASGGQQQQQPRDGAEADAEDSADEGEQGSLWWACESCQRSKDRRTNQAQKVQAPIVDIYSDTAEQSRRQIGSAT